MAPNREGLPTAERREIANSHDECVKMAEFIKNKLSLTVKPTVVVICGSGLGGLADEVQEAKSIPYSEIPGFPVGNVQGHKNNLLFGKLSGQDVMCLQGRVHPYEGYNLAECALPMRIASLLGCETVLMTSAVGGVNKTLKQGDLMLLNDHIFVPGMALLGPLIGPNDERFGPRFPSATNLYDVKLRELAMKTAQRLDVHLRPGVYAMVGGPQFETPAEVRWLAAAGCDVVGMSVAHETLIARHCGMRVMAIALVTNLSEHNSNALQQDGLHQEVLEMGKRAATRTARIIRGILEDLDNDEMQYQRKQSHMAVSNGHQLAALEKLRQAHANK